MESKNKSQRSSNTTFFKTDYCAGCGGEIERNSAKYCNVCGKNLSEGYQPLDTIRSAHRMQGRAIVFERNNVKNFEQVVEPQELYEVNKNVISETAWASFVYSLVPYVGVVFIPLTFLLGSAGVFASFRKPLIGGRKLSLTAISLSIVVLMIQILLWWLLYIIPTLGRSF